MLWTTWGDEGKGKLFHLCKNNKYDFVCRWGGGNNAGHTIYKDNQKFKTHLIPSGYFTELNLIGPNCSKYRFFL